jgi:SAM-dependent methyltransferase
LATEKVIVSQWLEKLFGYYLVQVGDPALAGLTKNSQLQHTFLINPENKLYSAPPTLGFCQGVGEALPLASDSVDVLLLSHTLEVVEEPQILLQEAFRVLIPEGYLIITGFMPGLWWGSLHERYLKKQHIAGRRMGLMALRDGLDAHQLSFLTGELFSFTPLLLHSMLGQIHWLERWGETCLPFLGNAYAVLAIKHCAGLTPVRPKWIQKPWRAHALIQTTEFGQKNDGKCS